MSVKNLSLSQSSGANKMRFTNARSLVNGFYKFLSNRTGTTVNPATDLYVCNPQDVIANNMQYDEGIANYTPSGVATTEGQALYILGNYYQWVATGNPVWLERAENACNAYITYFYGGQAVPSTPTVWRSQWLVNAKEPITTFGPTYSNDPLSPGYKGLAISFVNGVATIPSEYNGPQLARLFSVFTGSLSYDSVRAPVTNTTNSPGVNYPFASFTAVDGNTYNSDYDIITNTYSDAPGVIRLVDTSITATLKIAAAMAIGPTVGTNVPMEVWPTWFAIDEANYGNSMDSEQWFCEACYLLWKATGNTTYQNAYLSSLATIENASILPPPYYYFRYAAGNSTLTPFTEGVSYSWDYSGYGATFTIGRDARGYILITKTAESDSSAQGEAALEQIGLFNQIQSNTSMNITVASSSTTTQLQVYTGISRDLDYVAEGSTGTSYRASFQVNTNTTTPPVLNVPFEKMLQTVDDSGNPFLIFTGQSFVGYGNGSTSSAYMVSPVNGISDFTGTMLIPDESSGTIAGFWDFDTETQRLQSITYQTLNAGGTSGTLGTVYIKLTDGLGNKYQRALPSSVGTWTTLDLSWTDPLLVPSPGQTGVPTTPTPNNALTQLEFVTEDTYAAAFALYCYGPLPSNYVPTSDNQDYSISYFLHFYDSAAFNVYVGDVTIENEATLTLNYTPGVIPFDTNYTPSLNTATYWRGTPYMGYQYPVIWAMNNDTTQVNNIVSMLYAAQQDHYSKIGVMGPVTPCYIWPRYDDLGQGSVNSFDWGTDSPFPWGGYQARSFWSMCHLWAYQVKNNQTVNPQLPEFCINFASYLCQFYTEQQLFPDNFPRTYIWEVTDGTNTIIGQLTAIATVLGPCTATLKTTQIVAGAAGNTMQINATVTDLGPLGGTATSTTSFTVAPVGGTQDLILNSFDNIPGVPVLDAYSTRDVVPYNDGGPIGHPDYVGHMTGLFLAGATEMLNAGDTSGYSAQLQQYAYEALKATYTVLPPSDPAAIMSGSYSSYVEGFYFYGFWYGEILRGLGLLMEYDSN